MVDHFVDHGHTEEGELVFRVRWLGYAQGDDTWEPIKHLARSQVLRYVRRKKLATPPTLREAQAG